MNAISRSMLCLLVVCLLVATALVGGPPKALAQKAALPSATPAIAPPDGRHDFDFEIGSWRTKLSLRIHPLSGSEEWVQYEGTTIVRKVWDGRANLAELEVTQDGNRIEGLALRLYNPSARQWSLNYSNSRDGTMSAPTIGEFKNSRGVFFGSDTLNGRAILVRFVIAKITANSAHFEQAFSGDGGETWETNWIADDERIGGTAR